MYRFIGVRICTWWSYWDSIPHYCDERDE